MTEPMRYSITDADLDKILDELRGALIGASPVLPDGPAVVHVQLVRRVFEHCMAIRSGRPLPEPADVPVATAAIHPGGVIYTNDGLP